MGTLKRVLPEVIIREAEDNLRRRYSEVLKEELESDRQQLEDSDEVAKEDVIIGIVGPMGRYQWLMVLLFSLMEFPHAWTMLSHKFISPEVDHWCAPPPNMQWTVEQWRNLSSPQGDSCHTYKGASSRSVSLSFSEAVQIKDLSEDLIACTHWDYDNSQFQNTLMQKWDLVCSSKYLTTAASSVFFAGTAVGIFLSGVLADKLGRRKVLLIFMTIYYMSGLVTATCSIFPVWMAARFLLGVATPAIWSIKTVMCLELVGSRWRAVIAVGFLQGLWSLGYISLPLVSHLLPDARHLQLVATLAMVPMVGVYKLVESPRWLLATGRLLQCREALQYIRKVNSVDKEFSLEEKVGASVRKGDVWDLFKSPKLRKNMLLMSITWFSLGTLYFGLSLNMPDFNADMYIVFLLSGLVELPVAFILPVLLDKFGRRLNLIYHFLIGGFLCIATAMVPLGVFYNEWPIVLLTLLGKYVSQAGWGIVNLYTNELFPTILRSNAVAFCCTFSRLGSMVSPFLASLRVVSPVLPIIIFGSMTMAAGALAYFLEETNTKRLPQSLQD